MRKNYSNNFISSRETKHIYKLNKIHRKKSIQIENNNDCANNLAFNTGHD